MLQYRRDAPSPRMRPLRGPRCRKRRRSTSRHFLQSSRLLDVAAMLRRTGAIGGNASRGFSVQMSGMRRRSGHPVNRGVRRPGASFGPALDGGRIGRRGRSIARMPQGWDVTIPEVVGLAGSGRARASPPHKTLSGFDIQLHYIQSEPAVDQLGGEFHGRFRGRKQPRYRWESRFLQFVTLYFYLRFCETEGKKAE